MAKPTAKERYTAFFLAELAKHPDVPPSRTVIAQQMGWQSSNHSGEMPKIRSQLLTDHGFVLVNGRWCKGRMVERHDNIRVGQTIWFDQSDQYVERVLKGRVGSIAVSADGRRWSMTARVYRDGMLTSHAVNVKPKELTMFPDLSDPDDVERWLAR